jgi:hypothetical protein
MQKHGEDHTEIPAQIPQLAETQHMGELLAVYPRNYKAYPVPIAIGVVAFIGVTAIALPLTVLPWTSYFLLLALLGVAIYLLLLWAGIVHRQDCVALYTEGFISLNKNIATAYRWENIEHILRGAPKSEGGGIADIDRITVRAGKNTFRLPGSMTTHARAEICDRIERGFVSARLPQVIAQYNAGEEIAFGTPPDGLGVSQSGFRDTRELLPWPMVEKAEVGSTLVIIRKEGRTSDWYHQLICHVPNAALLKALLDYRQYNM